METRNRMASSFGTFVLFTSVLKEFNVDFERGGEGNL